MMTEDNLADAETLVKGWHDYWLREGRLEGGLDKFARADLVERVAGALAKQKPAPKSRKKAQSNG